MNYLLDAITKAQQQIQSNSPVIYLYGCHFFLQIFYLDNHYQVVPKRHTKLPRILDFDKRHINLMISACKKTIDGVTTYDACMIERSELVCYMRSIIERKPDNFFIQNSERTMVPQKSHSVGYVGHLSSKESQKNSMDMKRSEVL